MYSAALTMRLSAWLSVSGDGSGRKSVSISALMRCLAVSRSIGCSSSALSITHDRKNYRGTCSLGGEAYTAPDGAIRKPSRGAHISSRTAIDARRGKEFLMNPRKRLEKLTARESAQVLSATLSRTMLAAPLNLQSQPGPLS